MLWKVHILVNIMQQSTEETSADGKDGIPTDTIVDHVEAVHTRTRAHTRGQLHA